MKGRSTTASIAVSKTVDHGSIPCAPAKFHAHPAWITLWSLLYASFLVLGLILPDSLAVSIIKLTGIFLCVLFVLFQFRNDRLIQLAFLCTFAADLVLAADNTAATGVLVFCGAQLAHFMRLSKSGTAARIWLIAALVILIAGTLTPTGVNIFFYGAVYAGTLISNLILAIRWYHHNHSFYSLVAMIGFILFLACDINVACSYGTVIGIFPAAVHGFADYLSWVFYYPSQILLAHSSRSVVK